jgi:ABC-type transport system involved in multi-copper enzyme maturation permease subunit
MRAVLIIANFVLLEARRTGMPWLFACAGIAGVGLAGFLSQLALTDSTGLQSSMLGAFFRFSAVFLVTAFAISSMVRESNDKGIELLLSMPISKTQYFLGKLGGFVACGFVISAAFSLLMLIWSPPLSVAAWFVSLTVELALMAAVGLFFVLTLAQVVPALAAACSLYLLGRIVAAIQAISTGPLLSERSLIHQIAAFGVDAVALVLPPLDRATQSSWLVYGAPTSDELLRVVASLLLYVAFVSAAGLFDFHRRNL